MLSYDRQVEPPAPFVDILAAHPRNLESAQRLRAKLDTGSDISAIPLSLIDELGLSPESQIIVEGYDSRVATLATYYITLTVAQVRFQLLEVIAFPEPYILLGRDVLNDFYAQLNGPELTFDLSLDNPEA
jgi:predicted aspartyl protease